MGNETRRSHDRWTKALEPATENPFDISATARALNEFIEHGTVDSIHPKASALRAVAERLSLDAELMRDPVAKEVVDRYLTPTPPPSRPRRRAR